MCTGNKRKFDAVEANVQAEGTISGYKYMKVSAFVPMEEENPSQCNIYYRECYAKLSKDVIDALCQWQSDNSAGKRRGLEILISGNPGVGKSRLFLYILQEIKVNYPKILTQLVINCNKGYMKYVSNINTSIEFESVSDLTTISGDSDIVRLVEGRSDNLVVWSGASIVFASPGIPDIKLLMKKQTCRLYFMPPWSFDELMTAAELNKLEISENEMQDRVDKVGYIPRYVLCDRSAYETNEKSVFRAAKYVNCASEVLRYVHSNDAVPEEHFSHKVLQMLPTEDLRNYQLDFVSDEVAKIILNSIWDAKHSEMINLVTDLGTNVGEVFKGRVYEYLCHRFFSSDISRKLTHRLLPEVVSNQKVQPVSLSTKQVKESDWFKSVSNLADKIKMRGTSPMYYRPTSLNCPAVNAVYWSGDGHLLLLQISTL